MENIPDKEHKNVRNLILGGGVAGLSLQYFLDDEDSLVLERNIHPGGGCKTIKMFNNLYFLGPRKVRMRQETSDLVTETLSKLGLESYSTTPDVSLIKFRDRYVRFPFQANLIDLSIGDKMKAALTWANRPTFEPKTFEEWAVVKYGEFVAREFLIPHSEKCWKRSASEITLKANQKVMGGDTLDFLLSLSVGVPDEEERLVIDGGVNAIAQGFVESCRGPIYSGYKVDRGKINFEKKFVESDDIVVHYENLISTVPLPAFQHLPVDDPPESVQVAYESLDYNILGFVFVMVKNEDYIGPNNARMIYYPDKDTEFHRISFPDVDLPGEHNGHTLMAAEVSIHRRYKRLLNNDQFKLRLFGKVYYGMFKEGLINPNINEDTIGVEYQFINPGYILFDENYQWSVNLIKEYLEIYNVHLLGRFAQWNNLEIDTTIQQAKELASKLTWQKLL